MANSLEVYGKTLFCVLRVFEGGTTHVDVRSDGEQNDEK
jgi:hypothetical protein